MVTEAVECPTCGGSATGKKRYICRNSNCTRKTFIIDYTYQGHLPKVKQQIADMAINGSGIRDTGRVLGISPTTVIKELKKIRKTQNQSIILYQNNQILKQLMQIFIELKMWRWMKCGVLLVAKNSKDGYAPPIDHATGVVLAYVLASCASGLRFRLTDGTPNTFWNYSIFH